MSVQAVGWVMEQPVPPGPKLVLVSIANHADRLGRNSWPEQASIAIEATMGERTVRRHVQWLEAQGLIVRYRRGRRDGTGRSSDGYEIPGMTGETADQARRRLAADGKAVIWPDGAPVDEQAQPANMAGSDPDESEGSTGQLRQLNRPTSTAQPATGGRGTVRNRPEPREEEARDDRRQVAAAVLDRLPAKAVIRLDADPGTDAMLAALDRLQAAGWPPDAAADRLLANPLTDRRGRPVDSVAAVLRSRADRLAELDPPTATGPAGPDPACPDCHGTGTQAETVPGTHGRPDVTAYGPCSCRSAA